MGRRVRAQFSAEDGALSPGLLAFSVAALAGLLFFLQLGHANVLATESRTAADAAALAAADDLAPVSLIAPGLGHGVGQPHREHGEHLGGVRPAVGVRLPARHPRSTAMRRNERSMSARASRPSRSRP